jgi:transcriptional regulator with XRE-family HTH domain
MEVIVLHYLSISLPTGLARESALKTIGGNIRRERTARLISQDKLAAVAGLNVRTLAKIEAGELNVRPETLDNIRRALGCSLRSILGPYCPQPSTDARANTLASWLSRIF